MARHFIDTYEEATRERNTPAKRSMERDGGLCTAPGCSKAADHSHHIEFLSHGGSDDERNRTSLCSAHHLRGVHKGHVHVSGSAPDDLRWEIGEGR